MAQDNSRADYKPQNAQTIRPEDATKLDLLAQAQEMNGSKATTYNHSNAPQTLQDQSQHSRRTVFGTLQLIVSVVLLFLNYFCSQYDKFILSYFQDSFSQSLNLSSTEYGILSGYATGIVYALLAIPIAFVADHFPYARVWTLTIASIWWSLCVVFQSLCDRFWQVLLARIGMGIGQSCVEALSISLISDFVRWRNVFLGTSFFYVGVYIGEAVSGQIAVAFPSSDDGWRIALRSIGITGIVLGVLLRVVIRDPRRQHSIVEAAEKCEQEIDSMPRQSMHEKVNAAKVEFLATLSYVLRTHSLWILVLSAGFRQLGGNVFGYYMPSYLANIYPDKPELLSRYGIIVGVVGSVTVLTGGIVTSLLWSRTKLTPVYLTGIGGMISSLFVLLMIFSRHIANGDQTQGLKILYSTMTLAYVTAELWLGALNGLIALILPPKHKTYGLAIWSTIQVIIYSSGPQIIGLALQNTNIGSSAYTKDTQIILAVMIPLSYWIAGIGFVFAIKPLKRDLKGDIRIGKLSQRVRITAWAVVLFLVAMVIALFVSSIVYALI